MEGVVCVAVLMRFVVGLLQNREEGGIAFALRCKGHLQVLEVSCSSSR